MNCPVCKVPMIAVERERVEVDYCISCRGLWFDRGEIELLAEVFRIPLDAAVLMSAPGVQSTEKPRQCPRCRKKMDKVELDKALRLLTDRCPDGEGLFFDHRELGMLFDRIRPAASSGAVVNYLGELFGGGTT